MKKLLILFLLVFIFFNVKASETDVRFNPNYIISDFELEDYNSMDIFDIQHFLNKQSGILKTYYALDKNSKFLSSAEIIYQSAQKHKINPKYLIVLLQKEQSLITDPKPSQKALDWATGFAICDSCEMDHPLLQKYKGFYNQVNYAAERNRFYIKNKIYPWLFQIDEEYEIDGNKVTPMNQATVNLYNYTPHINGNYNFWKLWQKWFTKKYPSGAILKAFNSPTVWLIEDGKKRPFITWGAFLSRYSSEDIIKVSYNDLEKYTIGLPIKYANYSYLRNPNKEVYLLDGDNLRKFASDDVMRFFGVNPEEIVDISWEDYDYYDLSEEINTGNLYPSGVLARNYKSELFYLKLGKKHRILDKNILKSNYNNQFILDVSEDELSNFKSEKSVQIKDGTLVKSKTKSAVYIISKGEKRAFFNGDIFEKLGYNWGDVIEFNDQVLNLHLEGSLIVLEEEILSPEELLPSEESNPL